MSIGALSRLIRLPNLAIMALTMCLVRYCIMQPLLQLQVKDVAMEDLDFMLLVFSVILIAAAGYIINDYFDTKIDAINRPDQQVVGVSVSHKGAILSHILLSGIGTLIAAYLAWKIHSLRFTIIHLLAGGLLWFYSTTYKRMFLIGNLVVAALSAAIPLLAAYYEPQHNKAILFYVHGYALFAFLLTMAREIVKDIEDMVGDGAYGSSTLPIIAGKNVAKLSAFLFCLITTAIVGWTQYMQYRSEDMLSFYYFSFAIQLPLLLVMVQLIRASTSKQFHGVSTLLKVTMLTGILSMYVFYHTLQPLLNR